MRIQDLEGRTGLERATIRFYEREGLLNPKRLENGYRDYTEEDVQQLLKIKLLRQLDMSVDKIKALQQGRDVFTASLDDQIWQLEQRIENNQRARENCRLIRIDGVDYQNLNASHYLALFREVTVAKPAAFHENVPKEIHPFRRFVAKILDLRLFSALVELILFVILRIRPLPTGILSTAIQFLILFLFLPVEALSLHLWGTTPGKWVMGIRVESAEGGKLPWFHALCRGWEVFMYGMGFHLPIWSWICAVKSYCLLTGRSWRPFIKYDELDGPVDMEWDRDTEVSYSNWEGKEKAVLVGMICLLFLLDGFIVLDCIRPRYRGEVTVAEFSANYNTYASMLEQNVIEIETLQPDGTWYENENIHIHRDMTGVPEDVYRNFVYETDSGNVRRISYQNSWTDILMYSPISKTGKCMYAAIAAASAQDWFNVFALYDFERQWRYETKQSTGNLRYENLEINWKMDLVNCELTSDGYVMPIEENTDTAIDLHFEIIIHEE